MGVFKTTYLSPAHGEITVHVMRAGRPEMRVEVDFGMPKFGQYTLSLPEIDGNLLSEVVDALLDKANADMMALGFDESVCVDVNASLLNSMSSPKTMLEEGKGDSVTTIRWKFPIPDKFIQEVRNKVVTAGKVDRIPPPKFKLPKPVKTPKPNAQRSIEMYRNQSIRNSPRPLYLMLYDQKGRVKDVLSVDRLTNRLFKR